MSRLKKGTIKEVNREKRSSWWARAWDYSINGIMVGRIYKQYYPGKIEPIYRFEVMKDSTHTWGLLSLSWKLHHHYPSKKAAIKAFKKHLKATIYTLALMLDPK